MAKRPTYTTHTNDLTSTISMAIGDLTQLGEEMREWFDNCSDGLQQSSKMQDVDSTASTLEGISEPDVDGVLANLPVTYTTQLPKRKGRSLSRAARRDDACGMLDACMSALDEIENSSVASELHGSLEQIKDEAEGCEFPGMYG